MCASAFNSKEFVVCCNKCAFLFLFLLLSLFVYSNWVLVVLCWFFYIPFFLSLSLLLLLVILFMILEFLDCMANMTCLLGLAHSTNTSTTQQQHTHTYNQTNDNQTMYKYIQFNIIWPTNIHTNLLVDHYKILVNYTVPGHGHIYSLCDIMIIHHATIRQSLHLILLIDIILIRLLYWLLHSLQQTVNKLYLHSCSFVTFSFSLFFS